MINPARQPRVVIVNFGAQCSDLVGATTISHLQRLKWNRVTLARPPAVDRQLERRDLERLGAGRMSIRTSPASTRLAETAACLWRL